MANIIYTFYYSPPEDRKLWKEMIGLCKESFQKNLLGDWEFRVDRLNEKLPQGEIFYEFFKRMHQMWKDGHNVLYINSDMICVKPTKIFGKYKRLTMFWHTDPTRTEEFPIHFNGGILYIPASLPKKIWDLGFDKYGEYMLQRDIPWATDQTVFNHMLYGQGVAPETFLNNKLHYLDKTPFLNEISKEDAHILHYFGTRGREEAFNNMRKDWVR